MLQDSANYLGKKHTIDKFDIQGLLKEADLNKNGKLEKN